MYTRTFRPLTGAEKEYVEEQIATTRPVATELTRQKTREVAKKAFLQGMLYGIVFALATVVFTYTLSQIRAAPASTLRIADALCIAILLLVVFPITLGIMNRSSSVHNHTDTQTYQAKILAEQHARWEDVLRNGTREVLHVETNRCWHYDLWPDQAYYEVYFFAVSEQETLCILDWGLDGKIASHIFELASYFPRDHWKYLVLGEEIEPERSLDAFPIPKEENPIDLVDYLAHGHIYPIALDDIETKLVPYLKQRDNEARTARSS
jgi:hypothetical protein